MHNRVDVLGVEVRSWSDGIEASGDGFGKDIEEGLHLALSISRSRTHFVTQRVVTLNHEKYQVLVRNMRSSIITDLFGDDQINSCGKGSFARQ